MSKFISLGAKQSFQPHQIICLEYQDTCLYGEVIQIITQRQQCWFRPLFLVKDFEPTTNTSKKFIQLQNSSDLLWPLCLFRYSLDTEVIPLLARLNDKNQVTIEESLSRKYLNQFIKQVWQANQDKF